MFIAPLFWCRSGRLVLLPILHATCTQESLGARETPSRFVQGFVLIASAARRLLGVDVRAVGKRVASMATDPGLPGRLTTRVPSVTGISRQAALRHLRYKTA